MNLAKDTNPRALKELLAEIHSRSAVLLDLQLWPEIRRVTGATEAADLEADAKDLE